MSTQIVFITHRWQIDNFNKQISIVENGGSISSNVFSFGSRAKFSIKLERSGTDRCALYLTCNKFLHKRKIRLDVTFWLERGIDEPRLKHDSKWTVSKASDTHLLKSGYSSSVMKKSAINDVWTVCCQIRHEELIIQFDETDSEDEKEEFMVRAKINRKVLALHLDGSLDSVVTIQAGNKKFKAGKLALMACSEVFDRMLSCTSSTEAKTGIVKIDDIKPETIDALICWIYQAEMKNIEEVAVDLYRTADKYDIGLLKKKCIRVMTKSMSTENLAPRLMLAYNFKEKKFKKHVLNFISKSNKNFKSLMASNEWLQFTAEDPEEAKKIVAEIPD